MKVLRIKDSVSSMILQETEAVSFRRWPISCVHFVILVMLLYFAIKPFIIWKTTVIEMSQDETYNDQITLQAIADLYNVHTHVVSTLGPQGSVDMNEENGTKTLILGHFAE